MHKPIKIIIFAGKFQLFSRGKTKIENMKVSLLKISRKKEVIRRLELSEMAEMIRENPDKDKVFNLRLNYQFYKPRRMPDGQITIDDEKHVVNLPRILFAADSMNYKEMQKGLKYNGLAVVEVNGLKTYEDAVTIKNQAARMDETLMAFLGASPSGRSTSGRLKAIMSFLTNSS